MSLVRSWADLSADSPDVGSSSKSTFGRAHQRPPHCDHLPLTAGELGRSPAHQRTQRRKQAGDLVYPGTDLRPRHTVAADLQVLPHGERFEHVVALRHITEAKPRQAAGALVRDVGAAEHDPAGPDPEQPGDRLEQRALARAVGPTIVTISPEPTCALTPRTTGDPL